MPTSPRLLALLLVIATAVSSHWTAALEDAARASAAGRCCASDDALALAATGHDTATRATSGDADGTGCCDGDAGARPTGSCCERASHASLAFSLPPATASRLERVALGLSSARAARLHGIRTAPEPRPPNVRVS